MNPDVAKLFHLDPQAKRPALVMLKKEAEKLSVFGLFFPTPIFVGALKINLLIGIALIYSFSFCRW